VKKGKHTGRIAQVSGLLIDSIDSLDNVSEWAINRRCIDSLDQVSGLLIDCE
jgi:hypothetical protein